MSLRPPSREVIRELGERFDFELTEDELSDLEELLPGTLTLYETVDRVADELSESRSDRSCDSRRAGPDDPYNAWITRCDVGAGGGPLEGWTVGLKDNISLAGVEMTCGSAVMEGYVPDRDAAVATRLLDAGATIVGKNNMDDMAFGGNGRTSAFGPVFNPHDDEHLAGGSSGGGAVAVATGEVDLALGTDQGGSVRVPAAWSGVVGFKPTFGLVPYTGIVGLSRRLDHVGTLTADVESAARALSVLAGPDGEDPRQPSSLPDRDYAASLSGDPGDLSIGVLEEGFDRAVGDERVDDAVRARLDALADRGATVERVSVDHHRATGDLYTVAMLEDLLATIEGEGLGHNWRGRRDVNWVESFGDARRTNGAAFPVTVKVALIAGAYTSEEYRSRYYAEAMNLLEAVAEEYAELAAAYDVIALPTTTELPQRYDPDDDRTDIIADAWTSLHNATIFNVTGQPAVSVPAGDVDGLPVGLQLVGARDEDAAVLSAARRVERASGAT